MHRIAENELYQVLLTPSTFTTRQASMLVAESRAQPLVRATICISLPRSAGLQILIIERLIISSPNQMVNYTPFTNKHYHNSILTGFWGFGEIGRASCRERVS